MNYLLTEHIHKIDTRFTDFRVRRVVVDLNDKLVTVEVVVPDMDTVEDFREQLENAIISYLDLAHLRVGVRLFKSHYDGYSLTNFCNEFLRGYPAIYALIGEDSIVVENKKEIYLNCDDRIHQYITAAEIENRLNKTLYANFCDTPIFKSRIVKHLSAEELELDVERFAPEVEDTELRRIRVAEKEPFIGDVVEGDASYIKDVISEGERILCGELSQKRQFFTKEKNKPFFKFLLTDPTGKIDVLFFPSKTNLSKAEALSDGDTVIISGNVQADTYRNKSSYTLNARRITYCKIPSAFKEVIHYKPVPKSYSFVRPAPFSGEPQQMSLEDLGGQQKQIPRYMQDRTFVVFDLETTGTDCMIDKVTEICGIKIVNGQLTEVFSTFVDPEIPIPKEITTLTGINDVMVAGKPKIQDIIPDFFKFCEGAILVAHNAPFDIGFIRRFAQPLDYNFDHVVIDTLPLARTNLRITKYRLENIADYYGYKNKGAHRALYDTEVLCYIFMNLCEFLKD